MDLIGRSSRVRSARLLKIIWAAWSMAAFAAAPAIAGAPAAGESGKEIDAARRLFEANLDAIRRRDRDAYLACYLNSDTLARAGSEGFTLGFKSHAAQTTQETWPDLFEAQDLHLVSVEPGVVYGTYRYRVKYGPREESGLSERLFIKTRDGWRIAVTSAFSAPASTPPPPRALAGATLVDGTGAPPVKDAVVLIRDGKIECAGSREKCPITEGYGTLDVSGLFIAPGLIDAHVHFSQTGWADGRPDSIDMRDRYPYEKVQAGLRAHPETFFRSYLCSGVTAVFDVGGYPWTWDLRSRAEKDTAAPHVAAAGPLLSTRDHWLNLPAERQFIYLSDEKTARDGVHYLSSFGTSAVKVWFIVDPNRNFDEMAAQVAAGGDEAKKAGLPLIVHATGLREAKAALKAGARLLVHSVWDLPVDDEFIHLMQENKSIYCPTLTVRDGYRRMFESALSGVPPTVDDPLSCVDAETLARVAESASVGKDKVAPGTTDRFAHLAESDALAGANLKRVHDAGIPIAMGTDAGNPLTLHGASVFAEMEAMEKAGMTPMDVLVASTRGGALAMGRDKDLGTIEAGKIADLVVVAADPTAKIANLRQVRYVIRGGVVRAQEELRAPAPAPRK
jgi:imidazolonepropionase-like amidohydrolase